MKFEFNDLGTLLGDYLADAGHLIEALIELFVRLAKALFHSATEAAECLGSMAKGLIPAA